MKKLNFKQPIKLVWVKKLFEVIDKYPNDPGMALFEFEDYAREKEKEINILLRGDQI